MLSRDNKVVVVSNFFLFLIYFTEEMFELSLLQISEGKSLKFQIQTTEETEVGVN